MCNSSQIKNYLEIFHHFPDFIDEKFFFLAGSGARFARGRHKKG